MTVHPALRILLFNGSLFGGGAEHVIATLARHLRATGHRITIASVHGRGEVQRELEGEGFDVVSLASAGRGSTLQLRRVVLDRQVDVVHSHDLRSLIDAGICRLRTPRLAHVHTFHFGNYPHLPGKHLLLESAFARVPDRLVAVGHAQRNAISRALWIPARRIETIWNGVDAEVAAAGSREEPHGEVPLIGSISTFGLQKGLPTLLEAAGLLRERGLRFRLMLVGEGPLRAELEADVARRGLGDHVVFTGWRPDASTALLPAFDIFVQSSHWEAMSIVILEAMATRRAIVATAVGENPLVLASGRSAILVPPRDASALADGLARVIEDAPLRRALADAAHAAYVKQFTGAAMAERYRQMYAQLAAVRSPGVRQRASSRVLPAPASTTSQDQVDA